MSMLNNVYIALTIVLLPIVSLWLFRRWKRGLAVVPTNKFYHYPTRLSWLRFDAGFWGSHTVQYETCTRDSVADAQAKNIIYRKLLSRSSSSPSPTMSLYLRALRIHAHERKLITQIQPHTLDVRAKSELNDRKIEWATATSMCYTVFDLQFMCAVVFIYLRICVSRSRTEMGDLECALDHQAAFYFKTAKYIATHKYTHVICIESHGKRLLLFVCNL